ncbi:type II toxin-antitoxin system YafQ family toxin [Bifidobacterium tibiigranuli]|uniref:Type II toxin-antitoxin system YafQ family toxin n=1 Tax=Bifidobacterium tibiigranuli TaxID=2172043 RepID=A0A5N6S3B2_9BIFI|nr:type II toxin-antitoxin system YafQ family toxin [Bifidobacterium tibiigranuli]KAE8128319.1 type II toxin-antitoxin system YafQ family toxin [Bifidobacterium tibiigranuli]
MERSSSFLRQVKRLRSKHYNLDLLEAAIQHLMSTDRNMLITHYRDHALTGNLQGYRELHIDSDWLLVYRIENNTLTLVLVATGSHDELL